MQIKVDTTHGDQRVEVKSIYQYEDENGEVRFEILEFELPRTKKLGRMQRRLSSGIVIARESWEGLEHLIYHLPEVLKQAQQGGTVFITHNERDADNLRQLGLVATTSPRGIAGFNERQCSHLAGAHVVILPPKDENERLSTKRVARTLTHQAASVLVLELPGEHKDMTDWLASGGSREELEEFLSLANKGLRVWNP